MSAWQLDMFAFLCRHKPTDIYTVQFTSGSTGDPKGCVFSRNTWKSRIAKVQQTLTNATNGHSSKAGPLLGHSLHGSISLVHLLYVSKL